MSIPYAITPTPDRDPLLLLQLLSLHHAIEEKEVIFPAKIDEILPLINMQFSNGHTLLTTALSHQQFETATQLIQAGALPHITGPLGFFPIEMAVKEGPDAEQVFIQLLEPCNPNFRLGHGKKSLLEFCLEQGAFWAAQLVLQAGGNLETRSPDNQDTALMRFAKSGNNDAITWILDNYDISIFLDVDDYHNSALNYAIANPHIDPFITNRLINQMTDAVPPPLADAAGTLTDSFRSVVAQCFTCAINDAASRGYLELFHNSFFNAAVSLGLCTLYDLLSEHAHAHNAHYLSIVDERDNSSLLMRAIQSTFFNPSLIAHIILDLGPVSVDAANRNCLHQIAAALRLKPEVELDIYKILTSKKLVPIFSNTRTDMVDQQGNFPATYLRDSLSSEEEACSDIKRHIIALLTPQGDIGEIPDASFELLLQIRIQHIEKPYFDQKSVVYQPNWIYTSYESIVYPMLMGAIESTFGNQRIESLEQINDRLYILNEILECWMVNGDTEQTTDSVLVELCKNHRELRLNSDFTPDGNIPKAASLTVYWLLVSVYIQDIIRSAQLYQDYLTILGERSDETPAIVDQEKSTLYIYSNKLAYFLETLPDLAKDNVPGTTLDLSFIRKSNRAPQELSPKHTSKACKALIRRFLKDHMSAEMDSPERASTATLLLYGFRGPGASKVMQQVQQYAENNFPKKRLPTHNA